MTAVSSEISEQIALKSEYGQAVCESIAQYLDKLGFSSEIELKRPVFAAAEFDLITDPFTQSRDLVGFWYDANRLRIGQIKFNCEGGFYAEFDVVQPHPSKKHWFVEAINAWGKPDNIRVDAKLLEIPRS